jgi:hypothetical protein
MCTALAVANVAFEEKNPMTSLMSDVAAGKLREDILGEKFSLRLWRSRFR